MNNPSPFERRRHKRINKNFIMTYYEKLHPHKKYEITQIKNISIGGLCFIAGRKYAPNTELCIELKTPFLADATALEGKVLDTQEKVKDMLYEIRLEFTFLNKDSEYLLSKVIEYFTNEKSNSDA